ncbi:trypsin-like peptidase domain-containing protein [Nonomuraea rubra]
MGGVFIHDRAGRHRRTLMSGPPLPGHATEPWRVRIRDTEGNIRGAGVSLTDGYVLTCAHVLDGTGGEVVVDFVALGDPVSLPARVRPELFVGPDEAGRGDVALIELDRHQPGGLDATLRRTALGWPREVRVFGFPGDVPYGVHTRATLAGQSGPHGEWLQMNGLGPHEPRVRAGFSGAGVVDAETGDVLGIVVGEYTGEAVAMSWMIPVETIVSHLPMALRWVTGESYADESFAEPSRPGADQAGITRRAIDWLNKRDTGDTLLVVLGRDAEAIRWITAVSGREQRSGITPAPGEPVPVPGSIDVAVDASRRSPDDVARRILDRAGIRLDGELPSAARIRAGVPPMTIVMHGIDEAERPGELLEGVLRPLAENGSRLVLVFRSESSPHLRTVRSWPVGTPAYRVERLTERLADLQALEQRVLGLLAKVVDRTPVDWRHGRLAGELKRLRAGPPDADGELRRLLERCERATARASRTLASHEKRLLRMKAERDRLRGLLGAYHATAGGAGLAEDLGLAPLYEAAYQALWRFPTDLAAAGGALEAYQRAIWRALGMGGTGDGDLL